MKKQDSIFQKMIKIQNCKNLRDFGGGSLLSKCYLMAYLAKTYDLKNYVEIGVYKGMSLFSVATAFQSNGGTVYGIDPYKLEEALQFDPGYATQLQVNNFVKSLDFEAIFSQLLLDIHTYELSDTIKIIRDTSSKAIVRFANISIGMLHIDGNHDAKNVEQDISLYGPLVQNGGIIVFDDINWDSVRKCYDNIKGDYIILFESEYFSILLKQDRTQQNLESAMQMSSKLETLYAKIRDIEIESASINQTAISGGVVQTALINIDMAMNRVYLNVGCGRAKLEGFVNVDLDPDADLQLDVRQGLPYADDSVHGIYSEHFIEHLSQAEATAFLRECRRVLVPGGLFRVATPDLDRVIEEYTTQNWRQPWMDQYDYQWIRTRAESLNVQMREWGNQWLFNEEELRRLGEFAGLGLVRRCALNESRDSMLSGRETRPESSLILEFTKLDESLPENPLVSIVMPAYKPAHFALALQSALAQTYEKIEILVLDDSDGEEIEAAVRAAQGRPIRYFRNLPRLGEIKSLTRGIELAKGELIKPLHDDDLLEPNCVRKLVEAMFRCPRASLATSRCTLIDVKGRTLLDPSFPLSLPITQVDSEIDGVTLAQAVFQKAMNQIGGPSAVLFRRSHALAIRPTVMCFSGIPIHGCGDVALYLNLMSRGNVVYLTQRLSRYRLHAGQIQRDPQTIAAGHKSWLFLRAHAQRLGLYRPDVTLPLRVRGLGETVWATPGLVESDLKNDLLQKALSHACQITPMNIRTRPSTITSKISIIIPVKNGGEQLRGLLGKITSQRKVQDVEIIIIDSESTDNSVEIARGYGAKVIKIPQREFNHGATRNLGAKEASGDYLVFTVQDAIPVSDYWLYKMICPFLEYPKLAALSSRQFVKPEADLFSLWMNETIVPYDRDVIYSLSDNLKDIDWRIFDSATKRRLTFFDNVSSCLKRSVFEEIQFATLIFAEEMDYGARLLERRKAIGYLTSTGVYRWHERGTDYVFKRHYIDTKAIVYVLKNDLPFFFDRNNISWECLAASIAGMYSLITLSIARLGDIDPDPVKAIKSFSNALQKNMDTFPDWREKALKEKKIQGSDGLDLLLRQVIGDTAFTIEEQYNFNQNFLIPGFMKHLENFAGYLYTKHHTLKGRKKDFILCLYKIFARTAGESLGAYYLEAESLNRLTPDLKRIDQLLGKGVYYGGDEIWERIER